MAGQLGLSILSALVVIACQSAAVPLTGHSFCPQVGVALKWTSDSNLYNFTNGHDICNLHNGTLLSARAFTSGCTSHDVPHPAWIDQFEHGKNDNIAYVTGSPDSSTRYLNASIHVVCEIRVPLTGHRYCPQVGAVLKWTPDSTHFNFTNGHDICNLHNGTLLSARAFTSGCTSHDVPHPAWIDQFEHGKNDNIAYVTGSPDSSTRYLNASIHVVCEIPVKCAVPAITDGVTDRLVLQYQENVTYSCTKNLTLVGVATQVCTANGSLSSVPPRCTFPASLTSAEFRCPYYPSTILKYFPVDMTFAKATDHCKAFNAKIATRTSCVKEFLSTSESNPVAWLAQKSEGLQYASDGKKYDVTSDPALKHKVVCETAPEGSHTCLKTRAHIGLYANKATLVQAKEQCRRLGGRLPAGSDEADCLMHAMHLAGDRSVAYKTKPWVLSYDERPLYPHSNSYYTLYDTNKIDVKMSKSLKFHTVSCAFNLREYFCELPVGETGVTMVHYPGRTFDTERENFCGNQNARMAINGSVRENRCIEEFRDLIHKTTGHWEENLQNQVCVFSPRDVYCETTGRKLRFYPQKMGIWDAYAHCTSVNGRMPERNEKWCITSNFIYKNNYGKREESATWLNFNFHNGENPTTTSGSSYPKVSPVKFYVVCTFPRFVHTVKSRYHFNGLDLFIAPNVNTYHEQHSCPEGTGPVYGGTLWSMRHDLYQTDLRNISFIYGHMGRYAWRFIGGDYRIYSIYSGNAQCGVRYPSYPDGQTIRSHQWHDSYSVALDSLEIFCNNKRPSLLCGKRTTRKIESLCGNWKVLVHTKTFEKLTYNNAQDACRSNIGFFLPSAALWNKVLIEMKTGDAGCRQLAETFDQIPLWFTVHGREPDTRHFASVCVGARLLAGSMTSRGIHRYEGFQYIDEEGHVTCKQGYRKSVLENTPAYPYKGMWQNTAGCYKHVGVQGGTQLNQVREDGSRKIFQQCEPAQKVSGWERTFKDGNVRCPKGHLWNCDPHPVVDVRCPSVEDELKMQPVCHNNKRINYARCFDLGKNGINIAHTYTDQFYVERETATFKCRWPTFESCTSPPCAGGRNQNRATIERSNSKTWRWDNLPKCATLASLTSGGQHWYYSHLETTVDRATMACEDVGTNLMTLAEAQTIRSSSLVNNPSLTQNFIWVLNPVSNVPIAFNIRTNQQQIDALTAEIMCKSSTKQAATCWTQDKVVLTIPYKHVNYAEAKTHCENAGTKIPLPFLHFCLDSLTRWAYSYDQYQEEHWVLDQFSSTDARASDLKVHKQTLQLRATCWTGTNRHEDDKIFVKHECRYHNLYYFVKETGSNYELASHDCIQRDMALPPVHIMQCVWLFSMKLGFPPAWMAGTYGTHGSIAKTSDNQARITGSAMTTVCAEAKESSSFW
ncbi:uncharacterized protein LOC135826304 [Sycon ciliatum]|uniref:uncharacterized protein LOC135826304 n=1 Tax=Sycon ciliatum TaxID=27933 RepID=UPI0031F70F97